MTNTPTTANAGTRSMSLNVTAVTAFAVPDDEADEREWLEEDERDDNDDDDDDPDGEELTDDTFEPRLVVSGIIDIKMGAIVPGGVVGVGVGTLAGGNGHQKSYVDDVVGMFVTGFCRRNGPPCISWSANIGIAEAYAVVGIGITTLAGGDGC
jgi:hypothetical protein